MNYNNYNEFKLKTQSICDQLKNKIKLNIHSEFRDFLYKEKTKRPILGKDNYFRESFEKTLYFIYLRELYNSIDELTFNEMFSHNTNANEIIKNKNFENVFVICYNRINKFDEDIKSFVGKVTGLWESNLTFKAINTFDMQWFTRNIKNKFKKEYFISELEELLQGFDKNIFETINENIIDVKDFKINKEWDKFISSDLSVSLEKFYYTFRELHDRELDIQIQTIMDLVQDNSLVILFDNQNEHMSTKYSFWNEKKIFNKLLKTNSALVTVSENNNFKNTLVNSLSVANFKNINGVFDFVSWGSHDDGVGTHNTKLEESSSLNQIWDEVISTKEIEDMNEPKDVTQTLEENVFETKPKVKKATSEDEELKIVKTQTLDELEEIFNTIDSVPDMKHLDKIEEVSNKNVFEEVKTIVVEEEKEPTRSIALEKLTQELTSDLKDVTAEFENTFSFDDAEDEIREAEKTITLEQEKDFESIVKLSEWKSTFSNFMENFSNKKSSLDLNYSNVDTSQFETFEKNLRKLNTEETFDFIVENGSVIFEQLNKSDVQAQFVMKMYTLYLHVEQELSKVNEKLEELDRG